MVRSQQRPALARIGCLVILAAMLGACGEPTNERRIERLEDDVEDLEERIEELEDRRQ